VTQPVFGCRTCQKNTNNHFGMCFGCSMNCHLNHDVFELFDKRGFRCDCGTPRSGSQCSLKSDPKEDDNASNKYNHNFDHLYCWCNSEYKQDQVMYQCMLCMDWFHLDCIQKKEEKSSIPGPDVPCEFICETCYQAHGFLKYYYNQLKLTTEQNQSTTSSGSACLLDTLKQSQPSTDVHNSFWIKGWRTSLCSCQECTKKYEQEEVSFLLTEPDQVENENDDEEEEEEKVGNSQAEHPDMLQVGQDAFLQLPIPHQQKVELMIGYGELVSGLKTYIRDLAESGKQEVTKRDIDGFFEGFRDTKRHKH